MLELRDISKRYPSFQMKDLSFHITKGEYFVLLGRSGSGKSMTLDIIAGLRKPDSGAVILNGSDITSDKIQDRGVGMVFQDFALFPHLTVFDNIAYPLKVKRLPKVNIQEKVNAIAREINIDQLLHRKPDTLSGGERQRVAVARTLVTSPKIILLDEPMSSVDTPLRDDIRRLLRKINSEGMTILHVTHDFREAIRLADRVGVIHNGHIIQTGVPDYVFSNPVNRFVARFAGIQNFFKVDISLRDKEYIALGRSGVEFTLQKGDYPANGLIMIRNDAIAIDIKSPGTKINMVKGVVIELNRSEFGYEAYVDAGEIFYINFSAKENIALNLMPGKEVYLSFKSSDLKVI
jgi:ABC-type Fe3+/spermidine/putrescine transport system ATPase subunit